MNANIRSCAFLHLNYVAAYGCMTFNVSSASLQKRKKITLQKKDITLIIN